MTLGQIMVGSYMKLVTVKRNGVDCQVEDWAMPLLSVRVIEEEEEGGESVLDDEDEAVKFDAETHIQQLEEVFIICNTVQHC